MAPADEEEKSFLSGQLCRVSAVEHRPRTNEWFPLILWDNTIRLRWQMEATIVNDVERCDVYVRGGYARTWRSVVDLPVSLDMWLPTTDGFWHLCFPHLEARAGSRTRPTMWEAVPTRADPHSEPEPYHINLQDRLPEDAPWTFKS